MTKKMFTALVASVSLLTLSGCVTNPETGEREISRTVLGAGGGSLIGGVLGQVIGGKTGRIIGAVGGGAVGTVVGYRMDQQIKELREQTAGQGIDVTETDGGDAILVNLPEGVTFATGSSTISASFRQVLDRVAANMVQYPNSLIDVYGYTDTVGSRESNQRLSEARASAVARYLIGQGVNQARIRSQGFGEDNLRVETGDGVNEPQNRRVEIKIVPLSDAEIRDAQN